MNIELHMYVDQNIALYIINKHKDDYVHQKSKIKHDNTCL